MSSFPTRVLPVKDTFRMSGDAVSTPAVAAWSPPTTTLSTPGGTPARSASCASAIADRGVSSAGRSTMVQPAASAGATFRAGIAAGKFQGVSSAHGPTAPPSVSMRRSARDAASTSPCGRLPSSAYHSKKSAA
jgi:hypothetical protein